MEKTFLFGILLLALILVSGCVETPAVLTYTPSVDVADQAVSDSSVRVDSVVSNASGWIVIHEDANGSPGAVIGHSAVKRGESRDVKVMITASSSEYLFAMLHTDLGNSGLYEFPGPDVPVRKDGSIVMKRFKLLDFNKTAGVTAAKEHNVSLELVGQGFASPVGIVSAHDKTKRLFIVDQTGIIWVLSGKTVLPEPFLNISKRMVSLRPSYDERGLLGLAFHPDYAENGLFYVYYSAPLGQNAPAGWNHTSILSQFKVSNNDDLADPDSEIVLMEIDQPQMNHDGGKIAFGPDGYLYIPLGDGGGANDVGLGHTNETGNAQDLTNVLGSILRIEVHENGTYSVPADNPLNGSAIFAYGFRNPFHISFDSGGDNSLFAADAGQNRWEEVDLVTSGGNYGWNIREGRHCFDPGNPDEETAGCAQSGASGEPLIDPVIEYKNLRAGGTGRVVVGGYVYRGNDLKGLEGMYLFGDWSGADGNGFLMAAEPSDTGPWKLSNLSIVGNGNNSLDGFFMGMGQDELNELYILTKKNVGPAGDTGKVYRLVPQEEKGAMETMQPQSVSISIKGFAFDPASVTITKGSTVTWTNEDSVAHTVTGSSFDSGGLSTGQSFSYVFGTSGEYDYQCTIHPNMKGKLIVE